MKGFTTSSLKPRGIATLGFHATVPPLFGDNYSFADHATVCQIPATREVVIEAMTSRAKRERMSGLAEAR